MLEIKEFFPMDQWEEMHHFIAECYRPDHALCSKSFFEWAFQLDPRRKQVTMACAFEGNRLLGIHGYVPIQAHWGDLTHPRAALSTMCWMVRKGAPAGLGWLLTQKIQNLTSLIIALNASPLGAPILVRLGWAFFEKVPRYLWVLDQDRCKPMLLEGATAEDLTAFVLPDGQAGEPMPQTPLNGSTYDPDWRVYPDMAFGAVRSLEYLDWRYIRHPMFKYHIVLTGQPRRPAVCVYRMERVFGDCQALAARIVDFFHPGDVQGRIDGLFLIRSVLAHLRRTGCAWADFICSNEGFSRTIQLAGGQQEPQGRPLLATRLTPIQLVTRHQNVVYFAAPGLPRPRLEQMYITKSDIDGDSPASLSIIDEECLRGSSYAR